MHDHIRFDWLRRRFAARAGVAVPVITLTVAVLVAGCGTANPPHATGPPHAAEAPHTAAAPHTAGPLASVGPAHATASSRTTKAPPVAGVPSTQRAPHATVAPPITRVLHASAQSRLVQTRRSSVTQTPRLPMASTYGTTPSAPQDPAPFKPETGIVIHPTTTRVIYSRPGGPAVGALPTTELGSPTWVPVVQSQPGWDRILLPTRPNRSTGWIYLGGGGLQTAYTPYQININLRSYRLTILDAGRRLGTWPVAEGAPGTPTPTGRTFVLASLVPRQPTYTPLILPLGAHSDTLSTFGGGPGTVGLHGWPDPAVFGHAVSHGCVRVPAAALRALSWVPLGSPVMITG
jgi:hypothetical protein